MQLFACPPRDHQFGRNETSKIPEVAIFAEDVIILPERTGQTIGRAAAREAGFSPSIPNP